MTAGMVLLIIFVGVPLYLLMEYPVIFWVIFVPVALLGIIKFIAWLKK